MVDKAQEVKSDSKTEKDTMASLDALQSLAQDFHISKNNDMSLVGGQQNTAGDYLPNMAITSGDTNQKALNDPGYLLSNYLNISGDETIQVQSFAPGGGEQTMMTDAELHKPIDEKTQQSLMRDADQFPPVKNADGSTTYTVVQAGLTDRPGRDSGVDYYRRVVNITVPVDRPSIADCQIKTNPREQISKEDFDKIIQKDKTTSSEVEFYTHGVSCQDNSADMQALMLQLTNGRPTINLDWSAIPAPGPMHPLKSLRAYAQDTISAKRANDNPEFRKAIDDTISEIGAERVDMIGFSHGGYFDSRYLSHRIQDHLPKVNTVVLAHPDVPVSAPELQVNGKDQFFTAAANRAYVIGGQSDLAMKAAVLASHLIPGTPTYVSGGSEERLGDDSGSTRDFIKSEGATPISERDRDELSSEHFLNSAGIRTLLDNPAGMMPNDQQQAAYNASTDIARLNVKTFASLVEQNILPNNDLLWQPAAS